MASILLIEDDESVRDVLCQALENAGHTCDCLATFREALDALMTGTHDLMIVDVRLPDGLGYDLMEPARGVGRKVMLITGHADERGSVEATAQNYLFKPFSPATFVSEVERQLRRPVVE
jgi:DNA-binding response OmpR family regulator